MPNLLRDALALLAGIAIGGGVNMALIACDWRSFSLRWCGGKRHDPRPCLVHCA